MAVNVSAIQVRRRRFVEDVLQIAAGVCVDGYGLDIEITETSLLQDLEETRRKLERLRRSGIRVAIDDFGTGYSSLGLLPTLPVDIFQCTHWQGYLHAHPMPVADLERFLEMKRGDG